MSPEKRKSRVEARFGAKGAIRVAPLGLLEEAAREALAALAPGGRLRPRGFWLLRRRLADLGVALVVPKEDGAWLRAHERRFTVTADRLQSGGLGLFYRGDDQRIDALVKRAAPKGWLRNPLHLGRVAKELEGAGARLAFTPRGEEALAALRRRKKVWVREAAGGVEVSHHPGLDKRLAAVVERWTTDEALDDPLTLPLLEEELLSGHCWLEVSEDARRLASLAGMSAVLIAPSVRFLHQAQVLPPLEQMAERTRGICAPFVDGFGLLAQPRAADNLLSSLREAGVEARVHPAVAELAAAADEIAAGAPDGLLELPLMPHQATGAAFLLRRGRALLADEMGLGKTVQAIAAVKMARERAGGELPALIVAPASLRGQWAEEIERFTGESAVVVRGPPAKRQALWEAPAPWRVCNYEILLRDDARPAAAGAILVLDEAHRLKNWRAKTVRAVAKLRPRMVFGLTGTPLENSLEELYTVLRAIEPEALGDAPGRFRSRYLVVNNFGGVVGTKREDEVARRLQGVMLRRRKAEVLADLPDLAERVHRVFLSPAQRGLYKKLSAQATAQWRELPAGEGFGDVLTALLRMREACDDPALLGEEGPSAKWDELLAILESLGDPPTSKAIIFTEWTRMARIIQDRLEKGGRPCRLFHGGIDEPARQAAVDDFLGLEEVAVLVATDAAAHGLNLQGAGLVINFDLPYNPAKVAQRIARAHRIGSQDPVLALHLVAEATVEERILGILRRKHALFEKVVGDTAAQFSAGLGMEEILEALLGKRTEKGGSSR